MDRGEQKALADIDQYGCHILHVAGEGELPPFSYSVGIQRSAGRPEVVVVGLKQPIAHFVINEYNRRVQEGETFTPGDRYEGFLEGFDVLIEQVDPQFYSDYFGWDLWLYGGPEFEVLQLVWPTTEGLWPWQPDASEWFRGWQPLLTKSPISPARYP
jgi:uncharacterized protein DUF4262